MNLRGLFSSRLRLAVDLAVLAAVGVVIVLLTQGPRTLHTYNPTAAQIRAASAWVSDVVLPVTAAPDPTDTACMLPVGRCMTSDAGTHSLAVDLHADLAAHGGSLGRISCSGSSTCDFTLSTHGVSGNAVVRGLTGYRRRRTVALIQVAGPTPPPARPLPTLASLHLTPGTVHVHLRCTVRLHDGCQQAAADFQAKGRMGAVASGWRSRLESSGWLVFGHPCAVIASHEQCVVNAMKSLTRAGGRFVLVSAVLTAHSTEALTGRLQLDAG